MDSNRKNQKIKKKVFGQKLKKSYLFFRFLAKKLLFDFFSF